ncbi:MAG TPA: hypothetical protein VFR47_14735 [Anaerolineales bacterium]|nr:hypothetical protein [Anaerolineales bacterium]
MKPMIVSSQEKNLSALLKKARRQNVILESADGQRFVLAPISNWQGFDVGHSDDFGEEVKKTAQNKKLAKFMANRRAKNKGKPRRSAEQVRKDLDLK